jgi:hypothetical protein
VAPQTVGSPHGGVDPFAESEAQPIGERETLAAAPAGGGPFGVDLGDWLDGDSVAGEQRAGEIPSAAVRAHLLRGFRPVGSAAEPTFGKTFRSAPTESADTGWSVIIDALSP